MRKLRVWHFLAAGREGIEPSLTASKAAVLPLDDLALFWGNGAGDGIRTRDLLLGKETFYY